MNKYFKEVVTHKSLSVKVGNRLVDVNLEKIMEKDGVPLSSELKNICAPIPMYLSDKLEDVLSQLRLSKRDFLTLAISSAIEEAVNIMKDIDIYEYYDRVSREEFAEIFDVPLSDLGAADHGYIEKEVIL